MKIEEKKIKNVQQFNVLKILRENRWIRINKKKNLPAVFRLVSFIYIIWIIWRNVQFCA